jgi:hypothetical protein
MNPTDFSGWISTGEVSPGSIAAAERSIGWRRLAYDAGLNARSGKTLLLSVRDEVWRRMWIVVIMLNVMGVPTRFLPR